MRGVARRRWAVLLLLAGIGWAGRAAWASPPPSTRPATDGASPVLESPNFPEHRLTLLRSGDLPPGAAVTSPPERVVSQPTLVETKPVEDPLPPALWSGLSLLLLAGVILSFRKWRAQLR